MPSLARPAVQGGGSVTIVVVDDAHRAEALCRQGYDVVLVVAEGVYAARGRSEDGGGRLAIFVGDPSDPATRAGAEEMDRELFGAASAG